MVKLWVAMVVFAWALLLLNDKHYLVLGFGVASSSKVQFRPGTQSDSWPIALKLAQELMNPLGVVGNGSRFVVAYTAEQPRIGWAQIRPISSSARQEAAIQKETDEAVWDDWEADDQIRVPVGLKSLPWTREYREFAQQARQRRRATLLRETRREKPLELYELASVWVAPQFRHQGVGTELVRRTLQRHCRQKGNLAKNIYMLTLASTAGWYRENFGFRLVSSLDDVPGPMAFEVQAGKLITGLIGAELVCMQGTEATGRL
jgi:ribosomal protein S18 acetylase RimI-like enzyme